MSLYDKEGNQIEYNKKSYNPQTQENELDVTPIPTGNYFNIHSKTLGDAVQTVDNAQNFSVAAGDWDEDYDPYIQAESYAELEAGRIEAQSTFTKALNAVTMGLMGAVGVALKDVGYMTSPTNYTQYSDWSSQDMLNPVSKALVAAGNWFEEGSESWAPIYEEAGDPNSISDQIFKWGTMKGVLESSLGFLIPGMIAGKAISGASKVLKASGSLLRYTSKLANFTKGQKLGIKLLRADKYVDAVRLANPKYSQAGESLGAMYFQGTGEAVWEAVDAHDEFLKSMAPAIAGGHVDGREVLKVANSIAEKTYAPNMAKSLLNLNMLSQFVPKVGKGLVKSAFKQELNKLVEMPLEGLEEGMQNIFKKEAEYRAIQEYAKGNQNSALLKELIRQKKYGTGLPSDTATRIMGFAATNEVIVDAIIGAISGPVQSGIGSMMRGNVTPGSSYRKNKKEFNEQQSQIKEMTNTMKSDTKLRDLMAEQHDRNVVNKEETTGDTLGAQTTEDLENNVTKAALAKSMQEAIEADPSLEPILKEQVFQSIIQESMAKGTFEALLKHAAQFKGTDAVSSSLYDYAKKVEKIYKRAETYSNRTQVVNTIHKISGMKAAKEAVISKITKIELIPETERTAIEKEWLTDASETVKRYDTLIENNEKALALMTSRKYQRQLFVQDRENEEADKLIQNINSATSETQLKAIKKMYPQVVKSREYITAANRMKNGQTAKEPETKESKGNKISRVEKIKRKYSKKRREAAAAKKKEGESSEVIKDNIKQLEDSEFHTYLEEQFTGEHALNVAELNTITQKLRDASKEFKAVATTQEEYDAMMEEASENIVSDVTKEKVKNSKEGKKIAEEVNTTVRAFAQGILPKATPEAEFKNMVLLVAKQNKLSDELEKAKNREGRYEKLDDNKLLEEIRVIKKARASVGKQLTASKTRFTKAAKREANFNSAQIDKSTSNTKGLPWEKIREDFNLFMEYMEDILGEEYVKNNYQVVRNTYTAYNRTNISPKAIDSFPATYDAYKNPEESILNEGVTIAGNKASQKNHADKLNTEESSKKVKRKRISHNQNPANSIAHLSKSYTEMEDDEGSLGIENEDNPKSDLIPALDPEQYNGGEAIEFTLKKDYEGPIHVGEIRGVKQTMLWAQLKPMLFELGVDGEILAIKEGGIAAIYTYLPGLSSNIESAYDLIPISITGQKKDNLKYVHGTPWINERTADTDEIPKMLDDLRLVRKKILDNILNKEKSTGTIAGKVIKMGEFGYSGFVMNYASEWGSADTRMPTKITMGVVTNSGVNLDSIDVTEDDIMNYSDMGKLASGIAIAIIPLGKVDGKMKYHAEPLYSTTLSENLQQVSISVIDTFLKKDTSSQVYAYYKEQGYDITTAADANRVLSAFMYMSEKKVNGSEVRTIYDELQSSSGTTARMELSIVNGVPQIVFGLNSPTKLTGQDLQENAEHKNLTHLHSLFSDNTVIFNTNLSNLKLSKKSKKVPITPVINANGTYTKQPGNYHEFVKRNTETRLQGETVNGDSGGTTYTVQTIIEFKIDATSSKPVPTPVSKEIQSEAIEDTESEKALSTSVVKEAPPAIKEEAIKEGMPTLTLSTSIEELSVSLGLSYDSAVKLKSAIVKKDTVTINSIYESSDKFKKEHPVVDLSIWNKLSEKQKRNVDIAYGYPSTTYESLSDLSEMSLSDTEYFNELIEDAILEATQGKEISRKNKICN